ncbi:unnamed protein product [Nyctereutes procyonoides]|uniref:(raccoon dog) hypothetical protein n=1 Tax=Nyctereutes procyonoides TaxID=34880 RepID=A0A811YRD6_NYCPR|nr:unnamed protein product [Nyctereutes procyonoides]
MLNVGRASLPALSHLESSQPSCCTVEGPKAQGAQRWGLGVGVGVETGRLLPVSEPAAAPHSRLRSPTRGTCCPARAGGRRGPTAHRLGTWAPRPPPGLRGLSAPAERPAVATSRGGGGAAAEFRSPRGPGSGRRARAGGSEGAAAFVRTRHGEAQAVPRAARAFHPAPPGRFPPRADGATCSRGRWARGGGGGGAEPSAWARRQPSTAAAGGATAERAGGRGVRRLQGSPRGPGPREGRRPSGPPRGDNMWSLTLGSSAVFLTPNVVIRWQQRDLQGGFVCRRAAATRPLLKGRPAAFRGDRPQIFFFPYQLGGGNLHFPPHLFLQI